MTRKGETSGIIALLQGMGADVTGVADMCRYDREVLGFGDDILQAIIWLHCRHQVSTSLGRGIHTSASERSDARLRSKASYVPRSRGVLR